MQEKLRTIAQFALELATMRFTAYVAIATLSIVCVAIAADSGSVFFQVRDLETGQPANLKLIDTGGGTKSPQVHLDSAVTLTDDTINFEVTDVTAAPGITPSPTPARAFMMQGYTNGIPVPVQEKKYASTTKLSEIYSASHITSNTTTTITSSTAYVSSLVITCTGVGTTETIVIRNKEGTPKVLYQSPTLTLGTVTPLPLAEPIIATSGIDIITAGVSAATVDVFITYWQ